MPTYEELTPAEKAIINDHRRLLKMCESNAQRSIMEVQHAQLVGIIVTVMQSVVHLSRLSVVSARLAGRK